MGLREDQGQKQHETCQSSRGIWGYLTETFRNLKRYWGKVLWILRIGEARNPGPCSPPSIKFSIECVNVGGWLSNGDYALESTSDFLAVVEHRLIPARARSVTNSLKVTAKLVSVWAPACQDTIPGGHAGVGVVSLKGAPLTLPTFSTPEFGEFFRLGRAIQVILPLANGRIAHLFVVYGYQGSCDDPHKLLLTNNLFEAVIGEAKVCGTGQLVVISGDFNVEPEVIPVVAKALQYGHLIDLEAAYSTGRRNPPSPTCRFALDGAPGTRRDFFLVCPNALAASTDGQVLVDRWFRPHFAICAQFGLGSGLQRFRLLDLLLLLLPLAGWTILTGPGILSLSLFRRFGVPLGAVGVLLLKMVSFLPTRLLVAPAHKVISHFWVEVVLYFALGW